MLQMKNVSLNVFFYLCSCGWFGEKNKATMLYFKTFFIHGFFMLISSLLIYFHVN